MGICSCLHPPVQACMVCTALQRDTAMCGLAKPDSLWVMLLNGHRLVVGSSYVRPNRYVSHVPALRACGSNVIVCAQYGAYTYLGFTFCYEYEYI